ISRLVLRAANAAVTVAAEGHVHLHFFNIPLDRHAFLSQVALDRPPESGICNPMRGPCRRRLESSRHLVLALRARLEPRKTALDAVLDSLVVARLEVQAVEVRGRTPVTPVQGTCSDEENRRGDRAALKLGQLDHDAARLCSAQRAKE